MAENSYIYNMTSQYTSIQAYAPKSFEISNIYMEGTNGISLRDIMVGRRFIIKDSTLQVWKAKDASQEGSSLVNIYASPGEISGVSFVRDERDQGASDRTTQRALHIEGSRSGIVIANSTFSNISSKEASAIYFNAAGTNNDTAAITVQNCTFFNNSAYAGGAVVIKDSEYITFVNNSFISNKAINYNNNTFASMQEEQNSFRGGAIYINNNQQKKKEDDAREIAKGCILCKVVFERGNIFKDNFAAI